MKQKTLEQKVLRHLITSTEAVTRAQAARVNRKFFAYKEENDQHSYTRIIYFMASDYYERSGGLILTDLEFEKQVRSNSKIDKKDVPRLMDVWENIKVEDYDENELHTLLELLKERTLLRLYREMVEKIYPALESEGIDGATEFVSKCLDEINDLRGEGTLAQTSLDLRDSAEYFVKELERRKLAGEDEGVMMGLEELDRTTQGTRPGQVLVAVSRSSGGKSIFLMNGGANAFHRGRNNVVYFSVEMEVWQCLLRHISWLSEINHKLLKGLKFSEEEKGRVVSLLDPMSGGDGEDEPYFIYDYFAHEPTTEYIERRLRQIIRERGRPDVVIVDYVGRLTTAKAPKNAKIWEQAGQAGMELVRIAGTYGISLWTAAQQSKSSISEQRKAKDHVGMDQDMVAGAHQLVSDASFVIGINSNREEMSMVIEPIKIREGGWFTPFKCKVDPNFNKITQLDPDALREWRQLAGYPVRAVSTEAEATSGGRAKITKQPEGGVTAELNMGEHTFTAEDLIFEVPESWNDV